ncbi:hypothetical protein KKC1_25450 [Calderihabitans maritimus]|uniref:Uncharacterized protein n=1 Tax=Calderihabitans maritimus TaxID=1246530 RepID=A0A1Z5HVR4_9FIRM|nr:hypothetical protein KKC1_25450 [Calderihabitans maritimus]
MKKKKRTHKIRGKKVIHMNVVLDKTSLRRARLLRAKELSTRITRKARAAKLTYEKIEKDVTEILESIKRDRTGRN